MTPAERHWHSGCNEGWQNGEPPLMNSLARLVPCLSLPVVALTLGACTLASPTHSNYYEAPAADSLTGSSSGAAAGSGAATSGGSSNPAPAGCDGASFIEVDVSSLTACGDGKGHCYDKAKVPWIAAELAACEGNEVCVPDSMLTSGGDTPKSCTSVLGAGGCASLLIGALNSNKGSLTQDVCADGEICAPCVDPTKGNAPTPFCSAFGVYENACGSEAPAGSSGGSSGTAPAAAACCTKADGTSKGQCLAISAVPDDQRGDVSQLECSGGNACVPVAFVSNQPQKCEIGLMDGVCMDQCFSAYLEYSGGILEDDECGATEACVPCAALPDNTPGCQ